MEKLDELRSGGVKFFNIFIDHQKKLTSADLGDNCRKCLRDTFAKSNFNGEMIIKCDYIFHAYTFISVMAIKSMLEFYLANSCGNILECWQI